ncbi:hypothetical protein Syun_018491 [Stephania yunnanensis]|uniref:Uncharacterized protein n=1 Tax=Stephania yunnanensis TaxID=152371 RepID=A0AAP0ISG9_9MAGN
MMIEFFPRLGRKRRHSRIRYIRRRRLQGALVHYYCLIQPDDNSTDDEEVGDDQDWIENLESTLEVDDEEQPPLQQLPLIHQQFDQQHQLRPQVLQQHTDDNIITIEDYDDIPPCIFLDEYQGNFDSWMETIKKRDHDDQQQQVDEEEEPSPKRAKARVAN